MFTYSSAALIESDEGIRRSNKWALGLCSVQNKSQNALIEGS